MTATQLYSQPEPFVVSFGDFKYELIAEYHVDETGRCKIYISSYYDNMDIIDTEPYFLKTETAIIHIKKELRRVAKDTLSSIAQNTIKLNEIIFVSAIVYS